MVKIVQYHTPRGLLDTIRVDSTTVDFGFYGVVVGGVGPTDNNPFLVEGATLIIPWQRVLQIQTVED